MGRFENFTPVLQLEDLLTSAEEQMIEELVALPDSSSGQFIRKEGGSLVNADINIGIGTLVGLGDGRTINFTLPFTPSDPTEVILFVGGSPKFPIDDFVLIGDEVTFVSVPRDKQKIRILALK